MAGRRKIVVFVIIIAIIVAVIAGYFIYFKSPLKVASVKKTVEPTLVRAIVAKKQIWPIRIKLVGQVNAKKGHIIRSEVAGRIEQVQVRSGQSVTKGQLLFQINDKVLKAQLAEDIANLKVKKDYYLQIANIYKKDFASKTKYELALGDYNVAQAAVRKVKQQLILTQVYAPFSGDLGIVNVQLGQFVSAGAQLTELQNKNSLRVDVMVPSQYYHLINKGQTVLVKVNNKTSKLYKALIEAKSSAINEQSNAFKVRAQVSHPAGLISGMTVSVSLIINSKIKKLSVPQTAIKYSTFGNSILIIKNHRVYPKSVTLGDRRGSQVVVLAGLAEGDVVVTDDAFKLRPGQLVSVGK